MPSFISNLVQQRVWFDGGTLMLEKSSFDSMAAEEKAQHMDELGAAYLSDSIDLDHFVPLTIQGDGNCLLHAVATATNGGGTPIDLREKLTSELVENEHFYRLHLKLSDKDWANSLEAASLDGQYLGSEHIFALANVLRRPIILLDNKHVTAAYGEGEVRRFPRVCIPIATLYILHQWYTGRIVGRKTSGGSTTLLFAPTRLSSFHPLDQRPIRSPLDATLL